MVYSPKLVLALQKYFKNKYDKNLTDEEAGQYLESYASIYLLITKKDTYESPN